MSETLQNVAPIVQSVEIRASPERIFELLTKADELVKWMPDTASFDARVGGEVRFGYGGGKQLVGVVSRLDPPRAVAYSWTWEDDPDVTTHVEFTIEDLGDGRCRVEVVHSGWEQAADRRPPHEQGWTHFLPLLVGLAEGRPVTTPTPEEE